MPKHKSDNIINTRRVISWKRIGGNVGVKCRLLRRGYELEWANIGYVVAAKTRTPSWLALTLKDSDPVKETLTRLNPIHGLRNTPRG